MSSQGLTSGQVVSLSMVRLISATLLSAVSLTKFGTRVVKQEHAYGSHAAERLDHLPAVADPKSEAVMYFHGGGWVAGDKRYYTKDLAFLPQAGYAVFNVEYPLAPEYPHPHALHSVLRAVGWVKKNHSEVSALHMMGDSAGGNLAAMYGVLMSNPQLLGPIAPHADIDALLPARSVISLYGLLDRETSLGDDPEKIPAMTRLFLQSYGGVKALSGDRPAPEHAITPMDLEWTRHPRCFIGVGDKDFLQASSDRYADHLISMGIPTVIKQYPGAPHGFLNLRHDETPNLKRDVLEFLAGA